MKVVTIILLCIIIIGIGLKWYQDYEFNNNFIVDHSEITEETANDTAENNAQDSTMIVPNSAEDVTQDTINFRSLNWKKDTFYLKNPSFKKNR